MDMDKIIGTMRAKRNNKIIEAQDFSRCGYSKREMLVLADGYSMAVKDLSDLIAQQTPPCTGSSVQKKSNSPIARIEIKPKFEEKKCKVGYIRADMYPTDKVEFIEEISKVLVGYEEVSNLEIIDKINEIIDVINGEG